MEHQEYEKLKISPFDAEKGKKRKTSSQHQKALITSYFLNIKGSLLFPILLPPPAVVICHVNRYIMHKCCLFYCEFRIGWDI